MLPTKLFLTALMLTLGLSVPSFADVKNGETYKCGSQGNVTVNVTTNGTAGDCTVSVTQGGVTSPTTTGTPGSTAGSATESGSMTVPDGDGGPTCRVHNGKLQYQNSSGEWIDAGAPRKSRQNQAEHLTAGEPAPRAGTLRSPSYPDWPMRVGDLAPWDGMLSPGEEVISLP